MKNTKNSPRHTYAITERAAIDLTLSENPLGPSPQVIKALINGVEKSHLYPDEEKKLVALIARNHHVSENSVLLGAGANELLEDFLKVLALGKNIVVPSVTFPESVACMTLLQGSVTTVPLSSSLGLDLPALLKACTSDTRLIHLCNPNNPTGIWTDNNQLIKLAEVSSVPLLISEAGADFVGQTLIEKNLHPNLIVVRSFSKAYGLAGLRIGYSIASPEVISIMKSHLRSYRVSSLAIVAAIAALQDSGHLQKSVAYILQEKAWLMQEMHNLGFQVVPSQGQNFIAHVPKEYNHADHFCAVAEQYDMAVVNCSLYPGLDQYIRVSPQIRSINKKFIKILKQMQGGE